MVKKMKDKHPDTNKRKIIIANKANLNGVFIDEGQLGLVGSGKFYILGDNLELVLKTLNFGMIHIINVLTKYGQNFIENAVFKFIPDLRKMGIDDITEDEFYRLIKLTDEEIKVVKGGDKPAKITKPKKVVKPKVAKPKTKTLKELREECKKRGLKGYSTKRKNELEKMLE
jgi:hypothetical protein